jgi:hypothetical protein
VPVPLLLPVAEGLAVQLAVAERDTDAVTLPDGVWLGELARDGVAVVLSLPDCIAGNPSGASHCHVGCGSRRAASNASLLCLQFWLASLLLTCV